MLTLQQLLESDSIATLVAKLNQNFQSISLSNGGPQGIRGVQGIPGLPGRVGPTGATGAMGPTGTILGLVPFACTSGGPTNIGPSIPVLSPYGTVGPWPGASYEWLSYYHTPTGTGFTGGSRPPQHGDIYIDHSNQGYWQWLDRPDELGACDGVGGFTSGGAYSFTGAGSYPTLGATAGWAGDGWYFYPSDDTSAGMTGVWVEDHTTYLRGNPTPGPYLEGQYLDEVTSPLSIANARLLTKYGTVWITSGNDSTDNNSEGDFNTSSIGRWGVGPGNPKLQPGRYNAGVDRLLFKMSLDGLPYRSNVAVRGYTGPAGILGIANPISPEMPSSAPIQGAPFWVSPFYTVSMEKYTPLLFMSHRDDETQEEEGTYSTLSFYMFTDTSANDDTAPSQVEGFDGAQYNNNNTSKSLHVMSTRFSVDPLQMYNGTLGTVTPINSSQTRNYGEFVMDVRRLIASNQYVCALPVDMKLTSETIIDTGGNKPIVYYTESPGYGYKTYQGFVSAINGKALTGDPLSADYWEYGLGSGSTYGPTGGTHDTASGTAGMQTRRTWYGTSVLGTKPSEWIGGTPGLNDYIRVAGMLERGRRYNVNFTTGEEAQPKTFFASELIFYTSQFNLQQTAGGVTNSNVDPLSNAHNSLPSLYISPFRNIGIGTFVGLSTTGADDKGPLEPLAKLHVHTKNPDVISDPTDITLNIPLGTGRYSTLPAYTVAGAAITADTQQTGALDPSKGYVDILLGHVRTATYERVNPSGGHIANLMGRDFNNTSSSTSFIRTAIRSEKWENSPYNTLRLGITPVDVDAHIGRSGVDYLHTEFQLALHPLNMFAADITNSLQAVSAVGMHNYYPRARTHIFGKNTFNEIIHNQELITPGYISAGGSGLAGGPTGNLGSHYPYYGNTASNGNSNNQVIIDYIGDSYTYPVGVYEYQYYGLPRNVSLMTVDQLYAYSPNSAVYPNRELSGVTRNSVPYGGIFRSNYAYPSLVPGASYNGSYKHGGVENAWFEPTSYIGFNLFRDVSSALDPTTTGANDLGDNRDKATWVIGTSGTNGRENGNNGAAAWMFSSHGEMGLVTIPRGYDGGNPYEQWEQRGIGTRDVLNHMKLVFDKHGNIAVGNGAGWDIDAYPSLEKNMFTGYVNYVPWDGPMSVNSGPATAWDGSTYSALNWNRYWNAFPPGTYRYGAPNYLGLPESPTSSPASLINKSATTPEYVRLEVAAEKAWSRDGRELQKVGFGYPPSTFISISGPLLSNYVNTTATNITNFEFQTDLEGRVIYSALKASFSDPLPTPAQIQAIVFPHPKEFNAGGPLASLIVGPYTAPIGALAAEWWGMSVDSPYISGLNYGVNTAEDNVGLWGEDYRTQYLGYPDAGFDEYSIYVIPTTDIRGSANLRLNNFVYGEGFGFEFNQTSLSNTGFPLTPNPSQPGTYTQRMAARKRQESPKIILSFLEGQVDLNKASVRGSALGRDPFMKVNTVIASAQNEASLREYWIPKSDNTGGTFMVWTDHMGSKEKDSGFDTQLTTIFGIDGTAGVANGTAGEVRGYTAGGPIEKLQILQVVTQEVMWGYTGPTNAVRSVTGPTSMRLGFTGFAGNNRPSWGFVSYYNNYSKLPDGTGNHFASNVFGEFVCVNALPAAPSFFGGTTGMTGLASGVATINSPVRRNIDYYYKIMPGSTAGYDDSQGLGQHNQATAIRFKRINSEFVLVDFNITVQVMNPRMSDEDINQQVSQIYSNWIDRKSPRMTQYMSFVYNIDQLDDGTATRPDWTEDLYGGGTWFSNWSTYNHWLPGTAVVGGDKVVRPDQGGNQPQPLSEVDSPYFVDITNGGGTDQIRTWTGNIIDYGYYELFGVGYLYPIGGFSMEAPGEGNSNPLRPAYGNATINAGISNKFFGVNATGGGFEFIDAFSFGNYSPYVYSTWGNMGMSRTRGMSWRMMPMRWTNQGGDINPITWDEKTRNTFKLEIMFDVPIMHTSHTLPNERLWGVSQPSSGWQPYKFLTVTGQGIIRYGKTVIPGQAEPAP
jgi:hypothetical protein